MLVEDCCRGNLSLPLFFLRFSKKRERRGGEGTFYFRTVEFLFSVFLFAASEEIHFHSRSCRDRSGIWHLFHLTAHILLMLMRV